MKKRTKNVFLTALFAGSIMALTACGGGGNQAPADNQNQGTANVQQQAPAVIPNTVINTTDGFTAGMALAAMDSLLEVYPSRLENNNPILQPGDAGNIIRTMTISNNGFPGGFDSIHSTEGMDGMINELIGGTLVRIDETFMWTDAGAASLRFVDSNTVEITLNHDIYWHDGVPLTLDDLVFAYELIAHPDYTMARFASTHFIPEVVGVDAFRAGTVDYISGLVLSNNNRTLTIHYTVDLPPAAQFGGGIWTTPVARHNVMPHIAEVGWGENGIGQHPVSRHETLGWGPWMINSVVPGESVLFDANPNYWRGRPNIDQLLFEVVPQAIGLASMREGLFDLTIQFVAAAHYEEHVLTNPNNYRFGAWQAQGQGFMYFRTGTMVEQPDATLLATPRTDNHPIMNVAIRKALAYGMDLELKMQTINNGLSVRAGSITNPFNARAMIDVDMPVFHFNPERANQILDDAGFTERGADGFRLNLDGQPMYFNAAFNHNAFNELAVPTYLQNWRAIGLDVRQYQNELIEWTTFVENVLNSDNWSENIHIMQSNWNMGMNPDPGSLWAHDIFFNMARHTSAELQGILADIASPASFDTDFMHDAFGRFAVYMYENAIAAPMQWGIQLFAVNNRVAGFDITRRDGHLSLPRSSHLWGLTSPTAYVNTN